MNVKNEIEVIDPIELVDDSNGLELFQKEMYIELNNLFLKNK